MKFKFRLEKTAKFFEKKEAAKKSELAQLNRKLLDLKIEAEKIKADNKELFKKNGVLQQLSGAWVSVLQNRVENNLADISRIETRMQTLELEITKKKEELKTVSQRKRALEKVREKKMSDFKLEKSRKDQKQLDENAQLLSLINE